MAKKKNRRTCFKLFKQRKALIDSVPDEAAGKAVKAVFHYLHTGEVADLDPLAFAVFDAIKPYVEENTERNGAAE